VDIFLSLASRFGAAKNNFAEVAGFLPDFRMRL